MTHANLPAGQTELENFDAKEIRGRDLRAVGNRGYGAAERACNSFRALTVA